MKKIMFNDRYGLTQAVLNGRKTMTRRIVPVKYVPLIQMKGIRIEKLQAIQNDDCMKEGSRIYTTGIPQCKTLVGGILEFIPPYGFDDYHHKHFCNFDSPREAFAALINKRGVGRPGLWELNPWVFAYEYVLRRPAAEHGCRMEGGGLNVEN